MQNFNIFKAFCLDTATNCIPFFKKHEPINYDVVDTDTKNWGNFEKKQKFKNDMWNESNKPPIELNSMIASNQTEIPVNRAPKSTSPIDKSKLIGNINEDQIKKMEKTSSPNEPDYFESLNFNTTDPQVSFNNVINSQTLKVSKANFDKGFNEKFKLEDNIEPGGNWLDDQDIRL